MNKKSLSKIISLRLILVLAIGASAFSAGVFFALPVFRKDMAEVKFMRVSVAAEVADTQSARVKGLSGRPSLPEFAGMLFVMDEPSAVGIWMKDMKFPIDILWIRGGTVIDMKERVQPPKSGASPGDIPVYYPVAPADFVLEVNAGFARAHDIHIGDRAGIMSQGNQFAYARMDDMGETRLVSFGSPLLPSGHEYFISTLRSRVLGGSGFQVGEVLAANEGYTRHAITYRSGDFTISGVMNVPKETPPPDGFPVLILNHGLISPSIYTTGRGSKREQDFFARHGYVTIHPDYRGHASSSPDTATRHDFYVGYTEDILSVVDAIKQSPPRFVDINRIGMWGHSMGGGIAARVMTMRPDIKAFVLFAPISADVEDNFYELALQEIQWLHDTYGPAGSDVYRKMSPIEYFDTVAAPVQIHHGTADTAVPILFSQKIYDALKAWNKSVEFFAYPGQKHEFIEDWPLAAARALQFFDHYVKK